jgi:Starch-binding associating with outer membrane/Prokaryotic membrane lipoprotein lipid attachment site
MKKLTIIFVAALMLSGCNKIKDFGDTNVNPQEVTTLYTSSVLANQMVGLAGWANSGRAGMYCQYFSEAEYPSTSRYSIPQLSFQGNYSGSLLALKTVIDKSTNANEKAVARILSQYLYWNMTDAWGDIPYSQALKGPSVIPVYDKQEDVYKAMIAELKSAVTGFDATNSLNGDLYYGGDISKWKKFANSMRCVMALRLSKRYPGATEYAAAQFKDALTTAGGVITSNDDNCKLTYPGGTYRNPYYETHLNARDLGESAPLVNLLASLGDNRQAAFGTSATGVPYGLDESGVNTWREANPGWSRIFADAYRTETYPTTIMNAGEVYLARAEALDRGWTTSEESGLAQSLSSLFQAGVNASFGRWNLPAPSAAYFSQAANVLVAPGANANLKAIAIQRYIATFPNGLQGWSEWRRTGFPVLTPATKPLSASHNQIPTRYTYAVDEYTQNPTGVATAVTRIKPSGTDVQEGKVWWNE